MMNNNQLVWFRSDLRLADNPAFYNACAQARQDGGRVYAIYLNTPEQWIQHQVAPVQVDLIQRTLGELTASLNARGIELITLTIPTFDDIPTLLADITQQLNIKTIHANVEPEINEITRDLQTSSLITGFSFYDGHCVFAPGTVTKANQEMFKVFTPFRNQWVKLAIEQGVEPCVLSDYCQSPEADDDSIDFPANDFDIDEYTAMFSRVHGCEIQSMAYCRAHWKGSEADVHRMMEEFIDSASGDYKEYRDFPAKPATSRLSPWLKLGVITSRQALSQLRRRYPNCMTNKSSPGFSWFNEIVWREFYRHLIVAFPQLCKGRNFNAAADNVQWEPSSGESFKRWCEGRTGYPLVDAAMKQLVATGWMHNRLRMVVASFLTKHLMIDWRAGEAFFNKHLIDGDLAANNGGWQWAASTGCDAQPYFRVFNPTTQSEKFDPEGQFIRQWIPALRDVIGKAIHQPGAAGYNMPIIEHKFARARAIERFETVMKNRTTG